jgi:hypothetical protein
VEVKLMLRKLLIVVFVLGLSVSGFAQKITKDANETVYITTTKVKVRESPPAKGLILVSGPGKDIFDLEKDAAVVVLEKQVIESVFSKSIWVRIRDLNSKKDGWIYWGNDEEKSVNLTQKEVK